MARARIKGDFRKLKKWQRQLKEATAPKFRKAILANVGEELVELVREGFEKERAPDGKKWAPLESREGKILQDSGRLRNSFHRTFLSAERVTVGAGVDYAGYHQTGTSRGLPARKMVPDGGKLPDKWERRVRDIAKGALKKHFR